MTSVFPEHSYQPDIINRQQINFHKLESSFFNETKSDSGLEADESLHVLSCVCEVTATQGPNRVEKFQRVIEKGERLTFYKLILFFLTSRLWHILVALMIEVGIYSYDIIAGD